jgi:drug/metabolite transporter (DMT)-like permease
VTRRQLGLFLAVAVLWGAPYALIKVSVDELSPLTLATARLGIGAVTLLPLALQRRAFTGLRQKLPILIPLALTELAAPFALIASGEQYISSSLTGILISAVPLVVAALTITTEPLGRARAAGLAIGITGVGLLLGVDVSGGTSRLAGAGMVLLACVGYAIGAIVLRRSFSDSRPEGVMCSMMAIAAGALLLPALLLEPHAAPSAGVAVAVLTLGVGPTGLAFALFARLNAELGPGRTSVIAYVAPVFAVLFGVAFLQESLRPAAVAGLVLILAGFHLSAHRAPAPPVTG